MGKQDRIHIATSRKCECGTRRLSRNFGILKKLFKSYVLMESAQRLYTALDGACRRLWPDWQAPLDHFRLSQPHHAQRYLDNIIIRTLSLNTIAAEHRINRHRQYTSFGRVNIHLDMSSEKVPYQYRCLACRTEPHECDGPPFITCQECKIARYCNLECRIAHHYRHLIICREVQRERIFLDLMNDPRADKLLTAASEYVILRSKATQAAKGLEGAHVSALRISLGK